MPEKVYLETDDEITSVIDKIKKTSTDNVEVVVPKRATLIQSIVNLKLLKRQSDFMNKKITLFINDEKGLNLARKAKLNIKSSLKTAPSKTKKELKEEIKTDSEEKKDIEEKEDHSNLSFAQIFKSNEIQDSKKSIEPQENKIFNSENKKIKSIKKPEKVNQDKKKSLNNNFFKINKRNKVHLVPTVNLRSFFIFFGVSIVVIALIFMMILPSAKIVIQPKTEPFSTSFDVVVSNNIESLDIDNLLIPGEAIENEEKSERKKFKATGEKNIGEKSRGEITVYNNYSSDSITLVPSTRFAAGEKIFYSLQEVTIPGASIENGEAVAGSARVRVEAENEGEEYNIGPSEFIIPNLSADRQQDIYGISSESFSGGASQIVKVVSQDDYEKAKEELFKSTFDSLVESISEKISEDKILAAGIMKKEILEINSSPGIDEEAEDFELDIKVKVTGYIVDRNDVGAIINNKFSELVPADKYLINNDISEGILFEPIEGVVSDEDSITAKINITKQVAWKLDEKKIKEDLRGLTSLEGVEYLNHNENILGSNIELWPFWVQTIPNNIKKIKIELDTNNNSDSI